MVRILWSCPVKYLQDRPTWLFKNFIDKSLSCWNEITSYLVTIGHGKMELCKSRDSRDFDVNRVFRQNLTMNKCVKINYYVAVSSSKFKLINI